MKKQLSRAAILIGICLAAGSFYSQGAARVIEVHAKRFSFTPSEITIHKGETIKLVLISDDVTHSLVIPDLGVKQEVKKGHPATIMIVANKAGDFHGKCGHFCGNGHGKMTFAVHVTDN